MAREMKDSGIEWIGEIPCSWKLIPFRYVLNERQEKNSPIKSMERLSLSIDFGVTLYAEKTTNLDRFKEDFEQYKLAYKGDLVMNSMNMIVGATGVSAYLGCVSPAYYTFYDELEDHVTAKYCEYIFKSKTMLRVLYSLGKGIYAIVRGNDRVNTCRLKVAKEDLKSIIIPLPPVAEQREITSYLGKRCFEIDNVLEKTRASIEEYKKLKQAIITQVVTKGIRSNREMKDSGIEWIGEIPVEWGTSQVKHSLKWKSKKGQMQEEVLSLYRDYGIIPKNSRDDNHNVTSLDISGYKLVEVGDFVINKMKAWQGSMAVSEYRGIISPAYHVCEFTDNKLNKKYFHYLMRNKSYLPEYARLSTGMRVGQWDLGFNDFKNIPFLLPPQKEQEEIVAYLDQKCSAIDNLIAKKEQYLSEIENYKKSLIYEYVTGKKDVP